MLMYLKQVPPNFYRSLQEVEFELVPDALHMAMIILPSKESEEVKVKYVFRIIACDTNKVYEAMITQQLYDGILADPSFADCKSYIYSKFEYLYGKDTIVVYCEKFSDQDLIYADGPKDNKEWQYDFHKFHI